MIRTVMIAMTEFLVIPHMAIAESPKPELQTFTSIEGKFTAVMPGKPKMQIQDVDSPSGKLKTHLGFVIVSLDLVYMISYVDLPASVAQEYPQVVLKRSRDGVLSKLNGKLITDSEIQLGKEKIPGRAILLEFPKGSYRTRLFLVDARLYQVVAIGSRKAVTSPDADKYLKSL